MTTASETNIESPTFNAASGITYTSPGTQALDVLTAIATDPKLPVDDRIRAAVAILDYVKL